MTPTKDIFRMIGSIQIRSDIRQYNYIHVKLSEFDNCTIVT